MLMMPGDVFYGVPRADGNDEDDDDESLCTLPTKCFLAFVTLTKSIWFNHGLTATDLKAL